MTNLPSTLLWATMRSRRSRRPPLPHPSERLPADRTRRWRRSCTRSRSRTRGPMGGETVYDLYCGTGTIGLSMADHALSVWGVDISEGVGLVRAREPRAEPDRQRAAFAGTSARSSRSSPSVPGRRTSSSSTRRGLGWRGRRSSGRASSGRRGSSTSPATPELGSRLRRQGAARAVRLRACADEAGRYVRTPRTSRPCRC